jgi:hypothetical protein
MPYIFLVDIVTKPSKSTLFLANQEPGLFLNKALTRPDNRGDTRTITHWCNNWEAMHSEDLRYSLSLQLSGSVYHIT